MYRQLVKNVTWIGVASIAVKPLWLLFITVLCMRYLGVENYGVFAVALSIAYLGIAFYDLGILEYLTREISKQRTKAHIFFATFLVARLFLIACAFGTACLIGLAFGHIGSSLHAIMLSAVYVVSLDLLSFSRVFYRAFEVFRYEAVSIVAEKGTVVLFGSIALFASGEPHVTLAGMAAASVALAIGSLYSIHKRIVRLDFKAFSLSFLRTELWGSIAFALAGFLFALYFRTDVIMLDWLMDAAAAGQYAAAFRIVEALHIIPIIVAQVVLYPRLTSLYFSHQTAVLRRLVTTTVLALAVVGLLMLLLVSATSSHIIRILDPSVEFAPAGPALSLLSFTIPFSYVNNILFITLLSTDRHYVRAVLLLGAAVLNILLNYAWIPTFGLGGAIYATILCEMLLSVTYGLVVVQTLFFRRGTASTRRIA